MGWFKPEKEKPVKLGKPSVKPENQCTSMLNISSEFRQCKLTKGHDGPHGANTSFGKAAWHDPGEK